MKLLNDKDYQEYPHQRFNIPNERDVRAVVQRGGLSPNEVVKHMVRERKGKQGVKQIVEEIVDRKTRRGKEGKAEWVDEL